MPLLLALSACGVQEEAQPVEPLERAAQPLTARGWAPFLNTPNAWTVGKGHQFCVGGACSNPAHYTIGNGNGPSPARCGAWAAREIDGQVSIDMLTYLGAPPAPCMRYHERGEMERGYDEIKTHLLDRQEVIRSRTSQGARQGKRGFTPDGLPATGVTGSRP